MGANIPSPDDFGKRLLHGTCGVVVGFFIGFFEGSPAHGLVGALIVGVLAFMYTDDCWERFGKG